MPDAAAGIRRASATQCGGYIHKLRLESHDGAAVEVQTVVSRSFAEVMAKSAGLVLVLGATVAVATVLAG